MASSSDSKPENETGNKIVAYKKVLDDVLNNGYEPDYKDSLNI
jgi:hypothetical protein